jgi:hypothetical protein
LLLGRAECSVEVAAEQADELAWLVLLHQVTGCAERLEPGAGYPLGELAAGCRRGDLAEQRLDLVCGSEPRRYELVLYRAIQRPGLRRPDRGAEHALVDRGRELLEDGVVLADE